MNTRTMLLRLRLVAFGVCCATPPLRAAYLDEPSPDAAPAEKERSADIPHDGSPPLPSEHEEFGPGDDREATAGFGRRPFGRHRPRVDYDDLSEAERERLEQFMQNHFSQRYEDLASLDATQPRLFRQRMNQLLPQMMRLMRMERDDPDAFPLRLEEVKASLEIRALMRRLRETSQTAAREDLQAEVRSALERRFDLEQRLHRAEIEKLERRLEEAKVSLERREADKEQIIAREVEEISSGRLPPDRDPKQRRPEARGR